MEKRLENCILKVFCQFKPFSWQRSDNFCITPKKLSILLQYSQNQLCWDLGVKHLTEKLELCRFCSR